jgi:HPt (histidine-containing phosphotransfer) domain-containing protein
VERLQETLRRVGLAKSAKDAEAAHAAVDFVKLRTLTGEDPEFVAELAHTFEANSRDLVAQMRVAAAGGDWQRVASNAHQLKGSSGNLHTTVLHELCAKLQTAAAGSDAGAARQALDLIGAELDRVCDALNSLVGPQQRRAGAALNP